jgi:hypothetical protein
MVTRWRGPSKDGVPPEIGRQGTVKPEGDRGDRATALIEHIRCEKIRGCSCRGGNTACLAANPQTCRDARQKVRYPLIATNFRFGAK